MALNKHLTKHVHCTNRVTYLKSGYVTQGQIRNTVYTRNPGFSSTFKYRTRAFTYRTCSVTYRTCTCTSTVMCTEQIHSNSKTNLHFYTIVYSSNRDKNSKYSQAVYIEPLKSYLSSLWSLLMDFSLDVLKVWNRSSLWLEIGSGKIRIDLYLMYPGVWSISDSNLSSKDSFVHLWIHCL